MNERNWVIRKRGLFYRPNRAGYTASITDAGRYTEAEAKAEAAHEPDKITAAPAADYVWKQFEAMARAIDPSLPSDLYGYELRITLNDDFQSVECIARNLAD